MTLIIRGSDFGRQSAGSPVSTFTQVEVTNTTALPVDFLSSTWVMLVIFTGSWLVFPVEGSSTSAVPVR